MSTPLRVRLDFHTALKLSELQQSWMAVPDDVQVIGDLYGHLVRTYLLRKQVRSPAHTPLWPATAFTLSQNYHECLRAMAVRTGAVAPSRRVSPTDVPAYLRAA